jgi:hypothetical protein
VEEEEPEDVMTGSVETEEVHEGVLSRERSDEECARSSYFEGRRRKAHTRSSERAVQPSTTLTDKLRGFL